MNKFSYLLNDGLIAVDHAKAFVGEFVYAPFGIESTSVINGFTLYFGLTTILYLMLRHRRDVRVTLQGRNRNEYGLWRHRDR